MSDNEFLIDCIWILNSSGVCIFEENYSDFVNKQYSADLIGGFLSALLTFADDAFADEIQYIKFSKNKVIFKASDNILLIISSRHSSSGEDDRFKKLSVEIVNRFEEKFKNFLNNF